MIRLCLIIFSQQDPLYPFETEDQADRIFSNSYAVGFPSRGFSLLKQNPESLTKGGPITVFYNPEDRRSSTIIKGVPHPFFNTFLFLLGCTVFFIPLLPGIIRTRAVRKSIEKRAPGMVDTLLKSSTRPKGRMRKGKTEG